MTDGFGLVIAPGRFDATLEQAQAAWDDYRAMRGVQIIAATEYGSGNFDGVLKADGWDHFRGGGECVVAWDAIEFEPAWKGNADRIGSPFFRGGNHDARTPITSVPLRHFATGRIVMVRVPHTPAHVQAGDGFRRTTPRVAGQVAAWVSALAVMGKRSRRFGRNHKNAAEVIAGDWNVDMHRPHWRGVISSALGLRCAMPLPRAGDLGKRLVSWAFHRGLIVESAAVLAKRDGFDHRPVLIRFSIKEK